MDINDYIIDQGERDWAELLSGWRESLPQSFTVWIVNRFGDVFAVLDDGSVHMLDVGTGQCQRLASSRDDFAAQIDVGGNAKSWLLIPLVDACVAEGMTLQGDQCYGYKVPPMLGGEYVVGNVEPTDLSVHYTLLADIYRQTKDLPDGTRVRTVVID